MNDYFLGLCATQWQAIGSIGSFFAAIVALLIAVLQDKMRSWFHHPKLDANVEMILPYCQKTIIRNDNAIAECYYFRIEIKNVGSREAKSVEVIAHKLLQKQENNTFVPYKRFLPLNLLWSHSRKVYYDSIPPKMSKYCDIGHIIQPDKRKEFTGEDFLISFAEIFFEHDITEETILSLDTEVRPLSSNQLLPYGEYKLIIQIGAANAKTILKTMKITFDGRWYKNEREMFDKGISISLLD